MFAGGDCLRCETLAEICFSHVSMMIYHKVFAHLFVCFWRELSYGGEFFAHKKKSTIPTLLYPLTVKHTHALEH